MPRSFRFGAFRSGHGPYLIGMLVPNRENPIQAFIIYFRPIRRRKHSIVFSIRQQIVIGPTPPGTGVMTEAFGSTAAKSTSPHNFPVSGSRFTPTSITTAPSRTCLLYTSDAADD